MTDPFAAPELSRERAEQLLEDLAVGRYGAELVGDESHLGYDAIGIDLDPIELKSCALRVRDGSSRRRGRWYFRERNHRTLLEESGRYLLGVYDQSPEIVAVASLPAERIDQLLGGVKWWETGASDHGGGGAQLCYTRVFPALDARLRRGLEPVSSSSEEPDQQREQEGETERAVSDGGARR